VNPLNNRHLDTKHAYRFALIISKEAAMRCKEIILSVVLTLVLLVAPITVLGQQLPKVYRIGFIVASPPTAPSIVLNRKAFEDGLRECGYIQGQNVLIDYRYAEGRDGRAPSLAAELVSLKPDVLVAHTSGAVRAAKEATSAIPIVMVGVIDPVGVGLVDSLARPGGNITGLTATAGVEIAGKYLQLLKETVPEVSRVAVLKYPGGAPGYRREMDSMAQSLNLTLQDYEVQKPEDLEGAFTEMTKARTDALLVHSHPFMTTHAGRIANLAAKSQLPAVYPLRVAVEAGGLMSYGYNQSASWRRIALYVDKILNGTKPGDLPIEEPTKYELVINLQTAKALGLTIPPAVLHRADELIK
jgi:putative ABC transport system substrate-binding protein